MVSVGRIESMKKWRNPWVLPIISGLMVGTSYIPFPPWALLFAYVPLFISLNGASNWKEIFKRAWITQFVFSLIGFHWVAHTIVEYGHLPTIVGFIFLFLFCALIHLHIVLGALLWYFIKTKVKLTPTGNWMVLALSMAAVEVSYPMLFPWHLGYTWLYGNFPAFQLARYVGFEGLSLITWILNALAFHGFQHLSVESPSNWLTDWRNRKNFGPLLQAFAIFLILNILGFTSARLLSLQTKSDIGRSGGPAASLKALVIQANIGNYEKYLAERVTDARGPIMDTYERLTREALIRHPDADMVIWPETAFPDNLDPQYLYGVYQSRFLSLVRESHRDFIVGSYSANPMTRRTYNGIFHFTPTGQLKEVYRKRVLLAFGEYMPFGELIPKLKEWFPEVSDFERGTETNLLQTERASFGPLICYEGLFPPLSAEAADRGADILLNLTNDSWYGDIFEPQQHMYMTLARAIEFGRTIIRSTNTGITTVAHPNGFIDEMGPQDHEWYHLYEIPLPAIDSPRTAFTYISPFIRWIFWVLLAAIIGVTRRGSNSES